MGGGAVGRGYGYDPLERAFVVRGLSGFRIQDGWCGGRACTLLVAVEGPEGAGVTLTVQLLARMFRWLVGEPDDVVVVKFPSNRATGHVARLVGLGLEGRGELAGLSRALVFLADFAYNLHLLLERAGRPPAVIVFDRYKYSWLGFQLLGLERWVAEMLYDLLPPAHILVVVDREAGVGGEVLADKGDARLYLTAPLEFEGMRQVFRRVEEALSEDMLEDCRGRNCSKSFWRRFKAFRGLVYPWRPPKIFRLDTGDCVVPTDKCLDSMVGLFARMLEFLASEGVVVGEGV